MSAVNSRRRCTHGSEEGSGIEAHEGGARRAVGWSTEADVRSELIRLGVRRLVEEVLEAELDARLGREHYRHRTDGTRGHRNGYRSGRLKSAEGEIVYGVPQVRGLGEPYRSRVREKVAGRTEELERLAVEMYARGLSTRDIEAAFSDDEGHSLLSRSAVSEVTEKPWEEYEAFATRDLSEHKLLYLFVDGVAEGVRAKAAYEAPSLEMAKALREDFVCQYEKELPSAVQCFSGDFEACTAHLRFPIAHRKVICKTNLLERLFGEERRRLKIIPNTFGERPVPKLMYAALIRTSEGWRGTKATAFERKQGEVIRKELAAEHGRQHASPITRTRGKRGRVIRG